MSTINLLPDDYLQTRRTRRASVMCSTLFVIVVGGVLGAQFATEAAMSNAKMVLDHVNSDYADAARLIDQMKQLQVQEQELMRRAELTANLIERVPRSTLLGVIAKALPKHTSLTKVQLQVERITRRARSEKSRMTRTKFKALSGSGSGTEQENLLVLEVTGQAGTDVEVARFITNLDRSVLIASVDLVYSKEKTVNKFRGREFQVKAELRSNIDAIELNRHTRGESTRNLALKWDHPRRQP